MKLLLINYEYPPLGGGGGVAHRAMAELLALRHEVTVLTTRAGGLPQEERRNGVRIVRVPVWGRTRASTATLRSMLTFVPSALLRGWPLIRRGRPDVLHAFFAVPSGLPAVILGRLTKTPVVLTLVGADVFDPAPTAGLAAHNHPLLRAVVRRVIRAADVATAISEDTKRRACQYHGAPADLRVIPLGLVRPATLPVEEQRSVRPGPGPAPDAATADQRHQADDQVRLLAIGRLIPRKAYDDLLLALHDLARPNVHLTIVGDGPLKEPLRARAAELGLATRVSFLGAVDELRKWELLRAADVFVSSSLYEGFGLVFLEAMAAGVPIVCTDTGGHTDILRHGENALFVPARQPRQLARALRYLLDDPGLGQRVVAANMARVQEFRMEGTVASYEREFEAVRHAYHRVRHASTVSPAGTPVRMPRR